MSSENDKLNLNLKKDVIEVKKKKSNGKDTEFKPVEHSQSGIDASPPMTPLEQKMKHMLANTIKPQETSKQEETFESSHPKYNYHRVVRYYTGNGTPFEVTDLKGLVEIPSAQQDTQNITRTFGPVKLTENPTDAYNGFADALIGRIGSLSHQMAEKVLFENFYPTHKPPETGDRLVYRNSSTKRLDAILIASKSPNGKLWANGQMGPGGGFYDYYDLNRVKNAFGCTPEVYRHKEEAFVRSFYECFSLGKDHVTTKGKHIRVFYPTKDVIVLSPKADKERIAKKSNIYKSLGLEPPHPIEPPTAKYNCFGHGILNKEGIITEKEEVNKAINDDKVIIENTSQAGDWKICRDSEKQPSHMAEILEMSGGEVHKLGSKEGLIAGLWKYDLDTLKKQYPGTWETRYKKTTIGNDLKRETSEYTTHKNIIDNAIANPNVINEKSPFTPAKLAAILTIADEFKKRAKLGIEKSNERNEKNAQKHLEMFRTRRIELSGVNKRLQGSFLEGQNKNEIYQPTTFDKEDPDKQLWERYEGLVMKQAKHDFENILLRNTMETNELLPQDAQQRTERDMQASLIRENVVEAMLNGEEQIHALDQFDTYVQRQDQERKDLLHTLNEWTQSLQRKMEKSNWSDGLKHNTTQYLNILEKTLTSQDEQFIESLLHHQFEHTISVLHTLAKANSDQYI